jgi:hypothetical protein
MTTPYNFLLMKDSVLGWLESLRVKNTNYGVYKFCEKGNSTLMSSCFAVFTRELLNDLSSLSDKERKDWIQYIKNTQDINTGLFIDPLLNEHNLSSKFSREYVLHQNTMFCLSALNALGAEPDYDLKIINSYRDASSIVGWLKKLNWSRPWLISNEIMFIMYFLQEDYERNQSERSLGSLNAIFDYLDRTQDPNTGFWGTNDGANIFNGMAGAFHLYFFYFYFEREIKHEEKIIDATLALQNTDGLFNPAGGGGHCEDLDAIDILVKFSMVSSYREVDIKEALMRACDGIVKNQNHDGGFCYAKMYRCTLSEWLDSIELVKPKLGLDFKTRLWMLEMKFGKQLLYPLIKDWVWKYSGWKVMSCRINQSDIWSTWFRLLALALISSRYPEEFGTDVAWKFRKNAGLGWHSNAIGENIILKKD